MRSALRHFGSMLLGAVLLVPALWAQDKDKDKKDTPEQKEKLIRLGDIAGKVTNIDANEKSLHLQVGRRDVKVMTTDDVKVRTKNPPVAYDDKGDKKKYTAKALETRLMPHATTTAGAPPQDGGVEGPEKGGA